MAPADSDAWYVIQTRPRHEQAVSRKLQQKGYRMFLPTYRSLRQWSDRRQEIELPLFEGYVFCRVALDHCWSIVSTTGVVRLVGTPGAPAQVPDSEVVSLQRIVEQRTRVVEPCSYLHVGQFVRITSGGLVGIAGIVQSFRGRLRVVVSVSLLQRSVAVELDNEDVTPAEDDVMQVA
jgi:transcription antitermination factor NusG